MCKLSASTVSSVCDMRVLFVPKEPAVLQSYAKEDTLKVNDVVEVVGVLSKVPELAALYHDGPDRSNGQNGVGGALFEEKHATHPPTSLVGCSFANN